MKGIETEKTDINYKGPVSGIGDLPCWRQYDTEYGVNVIYSVWEPSDEERKAIANGANIELGIVGEPIPPVSVNVTDQKRKVNGTNNSN
jgi:hypothetical protein